MDHMSGLHRIFWQDRVGLENLWDTTHSKTMDEDDFDHSRYSYTDWLVYQLLRLGCGPGNGAEAVEESHRVIHNLRGDTGPFWTPDGIEVLSPTADLIADCDESENFNNCSYVLKVTHAGRTVILPGDAETAAWESILYKPGAKAISCDILKASHHGRESGYHEEAVDAMSPEVVICSVGKKPDTDASDEYKSHGAEVFSTRHCGTITVKIWDDGDVWIQNYKGERVFTTE
jgi:beta-lactamase superfamily II metal-dependent hydrolase